METALATAPAPTKGKQPRTIRASIAHLHTLADAISEIDMLKSREPARLSHFHTQAMQGVAAIWHNGIYPVAAWDVEIDFETLEAFQTLLKCFGEVIVSDQLDLLPTLIETAYDLIVLMAGDQQHLIFDQED
jgi:hypothetical protein